MVTQPKTEMNTDIRTMLDILVLSFGIIAGGVAALLGMWFWFDYQANPSASILAALSTQIVALLPLGLQQLAAQQTLLMGLPLSGQTSAYWYMARAGGMIAYLLMWFSVVWGLVLSTKVTGKLIPMPLAYGLHEFLSILAVLFAALHAAVLMGDEYIKFNIFHLLVPFIAPYEPLWTGLGTIALYLLVALTASFYVRKHIGQKLWRTLHYLTFAAYLLALAHAIMAGSDSGAIVSVLLYWSTGFISLFLVYYRLFTLKVKPARA